MQNKSLESHQERRNAVNFQRGNNKLRVYKEIAQILTDVPKIFKGLSKAPKMILETTKELQRYKGLELHHAGTKGFYCVYTFKANKIGENNKITITANEKLGNQNIEVVNQKTQDRYHAENVSNENIAQEIVNVIKFLETGNLPENALLKEFSFDDMMNDPTPYVSKEVLKKTGFDQKIRDKIFAEEGVEEAAKYGKGLRGATK